VIRVHGSTRLNPKQIRLADMFSVVRLLASRGFEVSKEGDGTDTLLPKQDWTESEVDLMFAVFDDITARSELVKSIDSGASPSSDLVKNLLAAKDVETERQKFSHTFEWYIGELMRRKFMAFSSSYGVTVNGVMRNSDSGPAGDYDVLSILGDMELLYIECKTGSCSHQKIANTIERAVALHCYGSVVLLGAGLNKKTLQQQLKGLNYPGFEWKPNLYKIEVKGSPDSQVYKWHDCFFVAGNELSGNLEVKLRTVLRLLSARRVQVVRSMDMDPETYCQIGYDCQQISL
jgi:hypothetical protein